VSKTYPLDFRMQVVATFMNPLSDVAFRRPIVHKLWLENRVMCKRATPLSRSHLGRGEGRWGYGGASSRL
jgi:hypothetical protein